MSTKLYFVKILADALEQPDPANALLAAFRQIETLGRTKQYAQGYEQYLRFIEEMRKKTVQPKTRQEALTGRYLLYISLQIATGLMDRSDPEVKSVIDLIKSKTTWRIAFENNIKAVSDSVLKPHELELLLEKENNVLFSFPITPAPITKTIAGITPGLYSLRLNTGRILLTAELSETDLLWAAAFPQKDLPLAASTEDEEPEPTRQFRLLDGCLQVRVFAHIKSGYIEIIKGPAK